MAITVADLVPGITNKLGNRGDLQTVDANGQKQLYLWIRAAVWELTDNYQFEDLVVTGSVLQFTANTFQYAKNFFTASNEDWTDVRSWFMWLNTNITPVSGSINTSGSNIGWNIEGREIMVVSPLTQIPGPSKYWAQVGSNIIVGLCPDKAYFTQWRYQRKHPFTTIVASTDVIYMPDSWREVVEISAALRGAIEKRASDYIQMYDTILNGDEEYYATGGKKGKPGLIFGLVSQQQRNRTHNSRQLAPTVQRYGAR